MAPMPKGDSYTVREIYAAYARAAERWDSQGIDVSLAGNECSRFAWYAFRWAVEPAEMDGRQLRRIETGKLEEERLANNLKNIGIGIKDRQAPIQFVSGHVRGKIDGRATAVPEAPKTEHLLKTKAVNAKMFAKLNRHKLRNARIEHFAECQLGMHALGLTRCLYVAVNTDDDALYTERLDYDIHYASSLVARLSRIIGMDRPPPGLCSGPSDFRVTMCKFRGPCMEGALMRTTCRSCVHSIASLDGNAAWACSRYERSIPFDEQKQACPAHLHIPETVPGEQIDYDEVSDAVTYRMADGTIWINGGASVD